MRADEVRKAIAGLDPDKGRVLLMATSGDSYEQMAEVCGCEIGTIKSRVFRARNAVMASLGKTTYTGAVAAR
jgi:RNA polymerase sigma-70 factor (ECF subfamily)